MKISINLVSILFMLISLSCKASNINYRQDTGTIIPAEIHIEGPQTIDAPMGDSFQSPILKVKINNQGPFFFVFSTGSYETIISEKLAKTLQLPLVEAQSIHSNQGDRPLKDAYMISTMEIGGVLVKNYGVKVSKKFGNDTAQISTARIDGYLSANAFYELLLTIDLKKEKIHLEKGKLSASDDNVIPYSMTSPIPVIKGQIHFAKLNKDITQDFLLGTANYMYIFVNVCKIPEIPKIKNPKGKSVDIFGNQKMDYFTELQGDITLSKAIVLTNPYIYVGDAACSGPEILGLLGGAFFERYLVTIDQTNSLIRMIKN